MRSDSPAAALHCAQMVAAVTREVLEQDALAVILHGSLVLGDFVAGRSDIDLLVVTEEPLSAQRRERLVRATLDAAAGWPNRIDYRVVLRSVAAHPTPEPPMALWVEIDPRSVGGSAVHGPSTAELDLVVELSVCRAHGRSLLGAPPAELLAAVPPQWVDRAGWILLEQWLRPEQAFYSWFSVLTACRIWRFSEERRHCSKLAAGRWALRRDHSLEVVCQALRRQGGDSSAVISRHQADRLLASVRSRLGGAPS